MAKDICKGKGKPSSFEKEVKSGTPKSNPKGSPNGGSRSKGYGPDVAFGNGCLRGPKGPCLRKKGV